MLSAFQNTRRWSEGRWRTHTEEGVRYNVLGVGEADWQDSTKLNESGWTAIDRGRKVEERKVQA